MLLGDFPYMYTCNLKLFFFCVSAIIKLKGIYVFHFLQLCNNDMPRFGDNLPRLVLRNYTINILKNSKLQENIQFLRVMLVHYYISNNLNRCCCRPNPDQSRHCLANNTLVRVLDKRKDTRKCHITVTTPISLKSSTGNLYHLCESKTT